MALKRFTKAKFLEQIGRALLGKLFDCYRGDFDSHNVGLPDTNLEDNSYYDEVAKLARGQKGLPDDFVEALYRIEAMATPHGKERLLRATQDNGLQIERIQQATHADIAVQVMLAHPQLFSQKHDESRIVGLSSFDYYGCRDLDRQQSFETPDDAALGRIKNDIDIWLAEEREGDERVTEIEVFEVESEVLFLIRRGDSFARVPTVEGDRVLVRHFRPARDLVVGYSPDRDELRIYGKTGGEKQMIRRVFGRRLFGDPERFSIRKTFTLQPLRDDGQDALDITPGEGIDRIVLTLLECRTDDEHDAVLTWKANDLFAYAESCRQPAIPMRGRLVTAGFNVYFTGDGKPRAVYLQAGNRLRLTRHCDVAAVHRWLSARGFRNPEEAANRIAAAHGNPLERN